jgi:Fe-S cluster assembly iron-binding protein IscA
MRMNLSEAARAAIRDDLGPDRVLRVAFAGGCGALGFRLSTPRRGNADDLRLELPEITLFLDRQAAAELDGATLDYDEELGFVLDHPSWGLSC